MFSHVVFKIASEEDRASINMSLLQMKSHTCFDHQASIFSAALTVTGLRDTNKQILQSGCGEPGRCLPPLSADFSFLSWLSHRMLADMVKNTILGFKQAPW